MKIKKEKTVSEEGKSLLSTPGLDKLKKIKDFKSNADRVFGRKSPDLTKVAESFGGQIIGEPVELDETPALLAIPAVKYGVPAAIAVGAGAYDYYKKRKGERGIFPDLSGAVKKVGDTYNKAKDSIMQISGGTGQRKKYQKKEKSSSPDYSETSRKTGDMKGGRNNKNNKNNRVNPDTNKSFGDALKKNRKKFNKPEIKGDPVKGKSGGESPKGGKTKNVFSRIKDIVVGKSKKGQLLRTAGVSGTTATGVSTALKNKRGFKLPRPRVPDGGHVGRRTAG
jgi:hypothetical protein